MYESRRLSVRMTYLYLSAMWVSIQGVLLLLPLALTGLAVGIVRAITPAHPSGIQALLEVGTLVVFIAPTLIAYLFGFVELYTSKLEARSR